MEEVDRSALSSTRWEEKFFPNAQLAKLDIELFQQDLEEMRQYLMRGKFSSENEGWRYVLAAGYTYLRGSNSRFEFGYPSWYFPRTLNRV